MTIHSAKGLEAPVIFLADAANTPTSKEAYHAVVDWPAEAGKPGHFLLALKKSDQDRTVQEIFSNHQTEIQREQANLLYVALTRARQLLYVTGSQAKKNAGKTWHDAIRSQLEKHAHELEINADGSFVFTSNEMPNSVAIEPAVDQGNSVETIAALSKPLPAIETEIFLSPSLLNREETIEPVLRTAGKENTDAKMRGIVIHKILQLLSEVADRTQCRQQADLLFVKNASDDFIDQCWAEAVAIVDNKKFAYLFNASSFEKAYNEIPIQYRYRNFKIHGIIDRLVVSESTVYILDYKTARHSDENYLQELARSFQAQMSVYYHGVREIWPDKSVVAQILLTAHQTILEIDTPGLDDLMPDELGIENPL